MVRLTDIERDLINILNDGKGTKEGYYISGIIKRVLENRMLYDRNHTKLTMSKYDGIIEAIVVLKLGKYVTRLVWAKTDTSWQLSYDPQYGKKKTFTLDIPLVITPKSFCILDP